MSAGWTTEQLDPNRRYDAPASSRRLGGTGGAGFNCPSLGGTCGLGCQPPARFQAALAAWLAAMPSTPVTVGRSNTALSIVLLVATAAPSIPSQPPGAEPVVAQLNAADRARLDSGKVGLHQEPILGGAWPRVTVRIVLPAAPEEAAAVLFDYERHVEFIPGIRKSFVSRRISRAVADVDYVLAVPRSGH